MTAPGFDRVRRHRLHGLGVGWLVRAGCGAACMCGLGGCGLLASGADSKPVRPDAQRIVGVAGWTRIETTADYLVVVNVLPGERMFSSQEVQVEQPSEGELIIAGFGRPLADNVRHVEAHIYDRVTGKPLSNVAPTINVVNHSTGEITPVPATLMQDINIGALDIHYGNNVVVSGGSDLSVSVSVGGQAVLVDGHLD